MEKDKPKENFKRNNHLGTMRDTPGLLPNPISDVTSSLEKEDTILRTGAPFLVIADEKSDEEKKDPPVCGSCTVKTDLWLDNNREIEQEVREEGKFTEEKDIKRETAKRFMQIYVTHVQSIREEWSGKKEINDATPYWMDNGILMVDNNGKIESFQKAFIDRPLEKGKITQADAKTLKLAVMTAQSGQKHIEFPVIDDNGIRFISRWELQEDGSISHDMQRIVGPGERDLALEEARKMMEDRNQGKLKEVSHDGVYIFTEHNLYTRKIGAHREYHHDSIVWNRRETYGELQHYGGGSSEPKQTMKLNITKEEKNIILPPKTSGRFIHKEQVSHPKMVVRKKEYANPKQYQKDRLIEAARQRFKHIIFGIHFATRTGIGIGGALLLVQEAVVFPKKIVIQKEKRLVQKEVRKNKKRLEKLKRHKEFKRMRKEDARKKDVKEPEKRKMVFKEHATKIHAIKKEKPVNHRLKKEYRVMRKEKRKLRFETIQPEQKKEEIKKAKNISRLTIEYNKVVRKIRKIELGSKKKKQKEDGHIKSRRKEQIDQVAQKRPMLRFIQGIILFALFQEIKQTREVIVPEQAEIHREKMESDVIESPWIMLSIVWYLSAIREQGKVTVQKQKKKKKISVVLFDRNSPAYSRAAAVFML